MNLNLALLILTLSVNRSWALRGLPFYKSVPKFTYETISSAGNLFIDETASLTTGLFT